MASLTGNSVGSSYQGLLKTTNNGVIGATEQRITDGAGNDTNITIGTGGTSFDSGTVDFTGSTVTGLPSGGATPPMGLDSLPGMAQSTFSEYKSFRTWVPTTGYALGSSVGLRTDQAQLCVFAMPEGEVIDYIRIAIHTAQTAATGSGAIYEVGKDSNGNLVATNKLYDLPTFDASTTGVKDLDISSSPFTMPSGKDYGAVAIAFSTSVPDVRYNTWSQAVWTGNGGSFGGVAGTTWYRAMQWHVVDSGIGATTFPSSLASGTYDGETSQPLYIGINS